MDDHAKGIRKRGPVGNANDIKADLIAVVVAVNDYEPRVLTIGRANALPSGPFELGHLSLQSGLRSWVEEQTGQPLGYIEQLYTFARSRSGRHRAACDLDQLSRAHSRRRGNAVGQAVGRDGTTISPGRTTAPDLHRCWRRFCDRACSSGRRAQATMGRAENAGSGRQPPALPR